MKTQSLFVASLLATAPALGASNFYALDPALVNALDEHGAICTAHRPDGHAPIGVMADHIHHAGGWMFSLRQMHMHMEGMLDGTSSVSNADMFGAGYMVAPQEMDMDMTMLGAMRGVSDDLTLMLMVPYVQKSMELVTMGGAHFTTKAEGLGDVSLTGLYRCFDRGGQRLQANLGLYLPTGSTDERDATPMSASAKLPYPMQLGTGSFDLKPGVTWLLQKDELSFGAQASLRFSLDENDEGYRLGDRGDVTAWVAHDMGSFSVSGRLDWMHTGRIHGVDADLNASMVPTADAQLSGGERLDAAVGLNYMAGGANRFALEVGMPVAQDLNGPQMEMDWFISLGWQYSL